MKKRIFALALALCMMLSVMPNAFANGVLTLGDGTGTDSNGVLTLDNGTSGRSTTTSASVQPRQDGVLYGSGSEDGTTPVVDPVDDPVVDTSGALDGGETTAANSTDGVYTKLENTASPSGSADLFTDAGNKLELSKTVSASGDKITLEAFVTGKQVTSSVSSAAPMDVILILDTSREMGEKRYTFTEYTGTKTVSALRNQSISANGLYYEVEGIKYPVTIRLTAWWLIGLTYTVYYTDSNGVNHEIEELTLSIVGQPQSNKKYYTTTATEYIVNTQKVADLKNAANSFIDLLAAGDTNHRRVALLTYDSTTEILSGTLNTTDGALVNAKEHAATLKAAVDAISIDTTKAAYCDTALYAAKQIFQNGNATVPANRPRIVILLSAGIFGPSGTLSDTNTDGYTAMDMIWLSTILKEERGTDAEPDFSSSYYGYSDRSSTEFANKYGSYAGCGAKIYCVGIGMPNTDETVDENGRLVDEGTERSMAARINEVMYRVSSHRPDGTHVQNGTKYNSWENVLDEDGNSVDWSYHYWDTFTRNHEKGYFLTVNNTDDLADIFETISEDIITGGSGNSTLTTATVVKDVVSDYFVIPENVDGTYSINVYTAKYKGTDDSNITANDWETPVTFADADIDCDGKTVTVTNFSFTDNWVGSSSGSPHGYKLIIEVPIAPKTGFLGGRNIPTNDDANAGIYLDGTLVENFPATGAKTNVAIPAITVDVQNKNVYLSNEMTVAEMLSDAVVKIGDTTLNLKAENFGLASWQYAYLSEIEVVSTESDGSFKATCTVTDKAANTKSGEDSASVNVFKPHITFKDSTIYLGEKADYSKNNGSPLVVWKNGQTSSDDEGVTMTGNKPSVDVDYSIEKQEELYFTGCTDISITKVSLNDDGEDYKANTTFWNGKTKTNDSHQFTVHVVKPVVEFQPSTIYLGYEPTNDDFEDYNIVKAGDDHKITWTHTKDDGSYTEDYDYPDVTFAFDTKGADYTDCAPVSATVYSDGLKSHDGSFTVHVLKPSFSVQDGYIYQGQTKDLTECITLDGWSDKSTCEKNENIVGGEPDKDAFVFIVDGVADVEAFAEMECTDLTVTGASIKGKPAIDYFTTKDFTVHVLKPTFIVNTTDLWADYGTEVDLYMGGENYSAIDAVTNVSHTWVYTGDCSGDGVHPAELPAGTPTAPAITLNEVTFVEGDTYKVGTTDGMVTVNSVKYTSSAAGAKETYTDLVVKKNGEVTERVTIHVNKFDLTINKTWLDGEKAADGTYKQDAIFTVSGGLGDFQVVLPAGDADVTVTSLLCGQTYTVTEDDNWTWRWDSDNAVKTITGDPHDVSTTDPHDAEHDEEVSFVNSLAKRLWLSFCTFVKNIFGQAAIQKGGN